MDTLNIGQRVFHSRLLVGTGKYKDFDETRAAVEASGAEIVTVAIRRTNIGQDPNAPSLLDVLPPAHYTLLPNTAGCYSAEDAVRTLRLARTIADLDGSTGVLRRHIAEALIYRRTTIGAEADFDRRVAQRHEGFGLREGDDEQTPFLRA
jgi:hypothetical protein